MDNHRNLFFGTATADGPVRRYRRAALCEGAGVLGLCRDDAATLSALDVRTLITPMPGDPIFLRVKPRGQYDGRRLTLTFVLCGNNLTPFQIEG